MPILIDPSLVEAASSNEDALEQLILAVWPEAFRLAAGILHDRALAEDAAQEACASMASSLSSLKHSGAFRTWFYRMVVHEAISISRRRRETSTLQELALEPVQCDEAQSLDLARALQRLPEQQRALVLLHYYAGLNSREIAVVSRMPAPTIRFQLMLARRALRRALSIDAHSLSTEALPHAH